MKRNDEELDRILDDTLDKIRAARPDSLFEREALERVGSAIASPAGAGPADRAIRSCVDFQALIDPYLQGELTPARGLLVKDHFGECVPCRAALKRRRSAIERRPRPREERAPRRGFGARLGWRVAAAAVIFVAIWGLSVKTDVLSFESGGIVRVDAVEGEVFKLTGDVAVPLSEGDTVRLDENEGIRTAKDSSAVLSLADRSQVEMRERSELTVTERSYLLPGRRADGRIELERGSIIVEASDQGPGHLFVDTSDCRVAVTGTVFAVNHGIKGSRVSVIEGEVHVAHGGARDVLAPGEQATTSPALEAVPVEVEIAWSQKHDEYVALLRELRGLSREMEQALRPGLRYSTDLLDLVPAETAIVVAMPNIGEGLGEAWEILRARVATNPVLRGWWEEQVDGRLSGELENIVGKIRAYGDHLGPEIVLSVPYGSGGLGEPLFLARVTDARAVADLLRSDIAELAADSPGHAGLALIEGPLPAAPDAQASKMLFRIDGDMLTVSPSFANLRAAESIRRGQYVSLAGSSFHARLAERYEHGVEWLFGVDLETILADQRVDGTFAELGFGDVQHVIVERRQVEERTENRADLTFSRPRQRMAAWLAEPAPMGALDYVGPDASFVAAFVTKDVGTLVDELFQAIGAHERGFREELARFESEHGIDVRRDFAAPLGGEFVLALDGPMLPAPAWKLVLEVYDPARLQQTLAWAVEQIGREASRFGSQGVSLEREQHGDSTWLRLVSLDTGIEAHIAFDDGYAIVAPSRALVERALQTRATGITLVDSPKFRALLPSDREINFSGVLYHDLGPVLGPLSGAVGSLTEAGSEEQALLAAAAEEAAPGLTLVYGEPDRISLVAASEGGLLTSAFSALSGAHGLLGVQQSMIEGLTQAARAGHERATPGRAD